MVKRDELLVLRAISICFKPYLKAEEALIYCNIGRTQFAKNCAQYGVYKTNSGYFRKEDLDRMMAGIPPQRNAAAGVLKPIRSKASSQVTEGG